MTTPAPAESAQEPLIVDLRGPDGQTRRFPVEGGRSAIQTPRTVALRPGEFISIRWALAR
jgi:hypothetical protein